MLITEFVSFIQSYSSKNIYIGIIFPSLNPAKIFRFNSQMNWAQNKRIAHEPLHGSRDLFVMRYYSFPMNPEKKTLIP